MWAQNRELDCACHAFNIACEVSIFHLLHISNLIYQLTKSSVCIINYLIVNTQIKPSSLSYSHDIYILIKYHNSLKLKFVSLISDPIQPQLILQLVQTSPRVNRSHT